MTFKQRIFEIRAPLPSGEIASFLFYGDDENGKDLNYVFNALYAAARYNNVGEPSIIEKTERLVK